MANVEESCLLLDKRNAVARKHLRQLYADPLTHSVNWGIIKTEDGKSMVGICSLAKGKPIKLKNFPKELTNFELSASYSDWCFK